MDRPRRPITLQPSEFLKLGLVVFAATVLANKWRKMDDLKHLVMPLAPGGRLLSRCWSSCSATSAPRCDLRLGVRDAVRRGRADDATSPWTGFGSWRSWATWCSARAYRRTRFVDSFLNPWNDPKGAGLPADPGAHRAGLGRAGSGVGLGTSRQKWNYLPNAHTDFIFAIIGEELGLIGAIFDAGDVRTAAVRGHPHRGARARHVRAPPRGRRSRRGSGCRPSSTWGRHRGPADHRRAAAARVVRRNGAGRRRWPASACSRASRVGRAQGDPPKDGPTRKAPHERAG